MQLDLNAQTGPPVKTVKHLIAENPHVANLPPIMLQPLDTPITDNSLRAHAVAQLMLSVGFPASTIPILYSNPTFGGWGIGAGFVLGVGVRVFSSANLNKEIQNVISWAQRSAAMNTTTKATSAGFQSLLIVGNTLANFLVPGSDAYTLVQGMAAGVYTGFEFSGVAMSALHGIIEASTQSSTITPTDTVPLNETPQLNSHDEPINSDALDNTNKHIIVDIKDGDGNETI